jgi:hypothetical protein
MKGNRYFAKDSAATSFRRRFDRVALGFWLGALTLGTAGCVLGARMPCRHPVGVAISVLWWGIYLGCLGASVGALAGLVLGRAPVPPSQGADGAGEQQSGAAAPVPRVLRGAPGRWRGRNRGFDSATSGGGKCPGG